MCRISKNKPLRTTALKTQLNISKNPCYLLNEIKSYAVRDKVEN